MKQNIKRFLLMLCMAACLFSLTACSEEEKQNEYQMGQQEESQLTQTALTWFEGITGSDDAQLDELKIGVKRIHYHAIAEAIDAWKTTEKQVGAMKEITAVTPQVEDGGYSCVIAAEFENGPMECRMFFDLNMKVTSMSFIQETTFKDKMVKAALNTALGMGTVFAVLIFISLLIGCFKYINAWENKIRAKKETAVPVPVAVPVPAAVPVIEEAEELVDDLELVAVITAAIAASANTSADGLVVRSIKRASGAKWKKA